MAGQIAQRIRDEAREVERVLRIFGLGVEKIFPADRADPLAVAQADLAKAILQRRRGVARLAQQAETLAEHDFRLHRADRGVGNALITDEQRLPAVAKQRQRAFLETRVVAAGPGQIAVMLPVAIDEQHVELLCLHPFEQFADPALEDRAAGKGIVRQRMAGRPGCFG